MGDWPRSITILWSPLWFFCNIINSISLLSGSTQSDGIQVIFIFLVFFWPQVNLAFWEWFLRKSLSPFTFPKNIIWKMLCLLSKEALQKMSWPRASRSGKGPQPFHYLNYTVYREHGAFGSQNLTPKSSLLFVYPFASLSSVTWHVWVRAVNHLNWF